MAKKLYYTYTFDASARTISLKGQHKLRTLQLITNVTDGVIIYNFADGNKGGTTSYDSATGYTTITLEHDTTSMSDSDELQIFIDDQEERVDFSETFIDPVSKLRISSPENLIDTDFEYGLQSTKWETIELVDNIPSVYTRASGVSIGEIDTVQATQNSNSIVVTTGIAHDLSVGDPIEVQGTTSRTANGKYLITSVPSTTTFIYRASSVQSTTENLRTAYTTIIPGAFFSGSDITYKKDNGIESNNANPSTLTIETDYKHGLSSGTSVYITNTVGKKEFEVTNTSSTAADGSNTINTTDNSIYLPNHNLYTGQPVHISPGSGGSLPSLSSGSPIPSTDSTLDTAFTAASSVLDTVYTNLSSAGSQGAVLMRNDNGTGMWYNAGYFNEFNVPGRTTGAARQFLIYGHYGTTASVAQIRNSGNQNLGTYQWGTPNQNYNANQLLTGSVVDVGAFYTRTGGTGPATLSGILKTKMTRYESLQTTPYILQIWQFDDPGTHFTGGIRWYHYDYIYNNNRVYSTQYQPWDSFSVTNTATSLGNGWYYNYNIVRIQPYLISGTTYGSGYLRIDINLDNTNWPGTNASNGSWSNYSVNGVINLCPRDFSQRASHFRIQALIPWMPDSSNRVQSFSPSSVSGTVYTYSALAQAIAQEVADSIEYPSWDNASGNNDVKVVVQNGNRIRLKYDDIYSREFSFTSSGTGPIDIATDQIAGVVDNYYDITTSNATDFEITTTSQLPPRTLEFTNSEVISYNSDLYIKINGGHGIINGQKVTYNLVSGSSIGGLTNSTVYYAIVDDNLHLRLASSYADAIAGTNIISSAPASSGSYTLKVFSINGRSAATGFVSVSPTGLVVSGENTKFSSTYKIGDSFNIVSEDATVNNYVSRTITSIVSDTSLTIDSAVGFAVTSVNHYVDTKVNVRADGTFLHRPFDGGVDITAGTSPDSTIVRQTRKYFRYQSGKGIQCSMAINFNPARPIRLASGSGTSVTMTTEYPHGLTTGNSVKISGASDSAYNGTFTVTGTTDFTFSYTAGSSVSVANPTGFVEYAISGYSNAGIRAGLFDFQNGFFFEYDGSSLYAVRRSSVQQCSGTVTASKGSNIILGTNTRFQDQLSNGDKIVIRGQTYKITSIEAQDEIHIQPSYRGQSNNGIVITKTIDTKVAQSNWNIDVCDGNGVSGYNLDINKIQMVYMDYSWYGAGKIRFGFKDTYGHVKYVHEFVHNNTLNEAYMRSGNVPARYEAFNIGTPTYVPSLFHWGTSVIMDGGFDDDDSYLFTASGNTLTFTNGDADTATTTADSTLVSSGSRRYKDYYVKIPFATLDSSKFSTGIPLYTSGGELTGQTVTYTAYGTGSFDVYIYVSSGYSAPAVYPSVSSGTTVSIGAEVVGTTGVDLNGLIPLISIRLAPSADNNLIGALGERDIINRMQLKMKELGISVSHDANISVILNGSLSNLTYANVGTPSLSQYISHDAGDTIDSGTTIYQFRASGGSEDANGKRFSVSSAFDLSGLSDLGNSILGGDDVFPNGPDIITIAASVIDTSEIDSSSSFRVSSRLSWAESQA